MHLRNYDASLTIDHDSRTIVIRAETHKKNTATSAANSTLAQSRRNDDATTSDVSYIEEHRQTAKKRGDAHQDLKGLKI